MNWWAWMLVRVSLTLSRAADACGRWAQAMDPEHVTYRATTTKTVEREVS